MLSKRIAMVASHVQVVWQRLDRCAVPAASLRWGVLRPSNIRAAGGAGLGAMGVTVQRLSIHLLGIVFTAIGSVSPLLAEPGGIARPILGNLNYLHYARERYRAGDDWTKAAVDRAIRDANNKMTAGPYSVVYSKLVAPSGDPHDFVSYGAYWWPNPDTPSGLPWIRRDGHINPDNLGDGAGFCGLSRTVEPLSLAYYFTGDEKYADKAASLIRTWFLDEETYMNPRIEYAQIIPGRNHGAFDVPGLGNCAPGMFDAAGILESSPAWTAEDKRGLQQWVVNLMDWAETSAKGQIQFREPSNHGTNYDFLKAYFGAYSERPQEILESLQHFSTKRMPGQVASDGSNPLEMGRANNLLYHRYNLGRAWDLATMSRFVSEFDLFTFQLDDGRSLRRQLDYLLPYMVGDQEWTNWPGEPFLPEPFDYYEMLRKAAVYYQEPLLLDAADAVGTYSSGYIDLYYPRGVVRESLPGDLNADDAVTIDDIDWLGVNTRAGKLLRRYDLNQDLQVNINDRRQYLETVWGSMLGDSNLDGRFDSSDFVQVWQHGEYNDAVVANSVWVTGDWNGDGDFNEGDFVVALADGRYEQSRGVSPVPEPTGTFRLTLVLGSGLLCHWRRRPL
jgi:hypothetical protein